MERLTTVTRKGQITIPIEMRRALAIEEGDKIAVSMVVGEKGVIMIRPVRSVAEMTYGLARALSPHTLDQTHADAQKERDAFETGTAEAAMKPLTPPTMSTSTPQ